MKIDGWGAVSLFNKFLSVLIGGGFTKNPLFRNMTTANTVSISQFFCTWSIVLQLREYTALEKGAV